MPFLLALATPGCQHQAGICSPGAYRCELEVLEACRADGLAYEVVENCSTVGCDAAAGRCAVPEADGAVPSRAQNGPSCRDTMKCGGRCQDGTCEVRDCCESLRIEHGNWLMGMSTDGSDACPQNMGCYGEAMPEHLARVSPYYLDTFEVTVGRFQSFVSDYERWRGLGNPVDDAGHAPTVPGSGWVHSWSARLPETRTDFEKRLACYSEQQTYGRDVGYIGENPLRPRISSLPINCLSWYEAFAFCIWDGGRLPTEAEWELAATGGDENRLYPWGREPPDSTRMAPYVPNQSQALVSVGSYRAGDGRWGHADMAGSVREWVLDTPSNYSSNPCIDCVGLSSAERHILRGGSYDSPSWAYIASARDETWAAPDVPVYMADMGVRCARDH